MAPEEANGLIHLDTELRGAILRVRPVRIDRKPNATDSRLAILWFEQPRRANLGQYWTVGGDVAYVRKNPAYQRPEAMEELEMPLDRGAFRWQDYAEAIIVVLPHGQTLEFADPAPQAKVAANGRLAVMWKPGPVRFKVKTLVGSMEAEVERLNSVYGPEADANWQGERRSIQVERPRRWPSLLGHSLFGEEYEKKGLIGLVVAIGAAAAVVLATVTGASAAVTHATDLFSKPHQTPASVNTEWDVVDPTTGRGAACGQGTVVSFDSIDVRSGTGQVYRLDLRHSPTCHASWGRLSWDPSAEHPGTIYMVTMRLPDRRNSEYRDTPNTTRSDSHSDMIGTGRGGCVYTAVSIDGGPVIVTPCRTDSGQGVLTPTVPPLRAE